MATITLRCSCEATLDVSWAHGESEYGLTKIVDEWRAEHRICNPEYEREKAAESETDAA